MPVFLEDPSQFSKERLKSELIAHNVTLPPSESRKKDYLDLYLKNVDTTNAADFSSDDEDPRDVPLHVDGEQRAVTTPDMQDLSGLTDEDLKARLLQLGFQPGPITATTRSTYEKKLTKLMEQQAPHNGSGDEVAYSDSEEEGEEKEEAVELKQPETGVEADSCVDKDNAAGEMDKKWPSTFGGVPTLVKTFKTLKAPRLRVKAPKLRVKSKMDKSTMTNTHVPYTPATPAFQHQMAQVTSVTEVIMESLPETKTAPGIMATCRPPIKGAAGRPVKHKYPDVRLSTHSADLLEAQQRQVPMWLQLLLFVVLLALLFFTYSSMEESLENPFAQLADDLGEMAEAVAAVVEGSTVSEEVAVPGVDDSAVPLVSDAAVPPLTGE